MDVPGTANHMMIPLSKAVSLLSLGGRLLLENNYVEIKTSYKRGLRLAQKFWAEICMVPRVQGGRAYPERPGWSRYYHIPANWLEESRG